MNSFDKISVKEIVDEVSDGCLLGIPADYSGVPMQFTKELIKKGIKNLRLYCLPLTTIQGDMLIGSGCVSEIEAAAVTLGEFGLAPQFSYARSRLLRAARLRHEPLAGAARPPLLSDRAAAGRPPPHWSSCN